MALMLFEASEAGTTCRSVTKLMLAVEMGRQAAEGTIAIWHVR